MGTQIAGWFRRESPMKIKMMTRGNPIYATPPYCSDLFLAWDPLRGSERRQGAGAGGEQTWTLFGPYQPGAPAQRSKGKQQKSHGQIMGGYLKYPEIMFGEWGWLLQRLGFIAISSGFIRSSRSFVNGDPKFLEYESPKYWYALVDWKVTPPKEHQPTAA